MKWWRGWRSRFTAGAIASEPPPVVLVPESVYTMTECLLASSGRHERILYWAGVETARVWVVLTCMMPESTTTSGSFATTARANAEVINWAALRGLSILGQLHCHPGMAVGHSCGDDQGAFALFQYALSIVVPNYGSDGLEGFRRCGVHRFDGDRFRRLERIEVERILRMIPTLFEGRGAAIP
jgi:hypothetical protein